MKKRAFWAPVMVALAMALSVVAVSAHDDAGRAVFSGEAAVVAVGAVPPTASVFKYDKHGEIKSVTVSTSAEIVQADGLTATCKKDDSGTLCDRLTGSAILSVHSSVAKLRKVQTVANPLAPGLDALQGKLKGRLQGDFSVTTGSAGAIPGTADLKIKGSGTYGCFVFDFTIPPPAPPIAPAPVSTCEASAGFLLPLALDVTDKGKFEFGQGVGLYDDVLGGHGKVTVTVSGAPGVPGGITGVIKIKNAKIDLVGGEVEGEEGADD